MEYSGTDLLETFHNLGINTGNVSRLTIDSWFDTDCEDTKALLQWLCTSLGKENVLTACENEEYDNLLENASLLSGKQYETALEQIQIEYPGILDYNSNSSQVESMEDELEMLLEEEHHLEQQLLLNGNLSKKLLRELKKINEDELQVALKKKEAERKCMQLSSQLDEAHERLQSQIERYAEHLNEFEHAAKPMFVSNVPSLSYHQYYMDIVSYVNTFLRKEHGLYPRPDVSVRKLQNNTQFLSISTNQQDVLRQRIFKSMQNYLSKQLKEVMLQAELRFLQNIDVNEIISSGCFNDNILLEANVLSKEELLQCVCSDMENVIKKVCDAYVDTPQISIIENNINTKQRKLDILTKLENKLSVILARHVLLFLFIEREKMDIQMTDKFFRDVHHYITYNLQKCQQRTESMVDVTNDYKIYKNLPLEQKFKLINVLKALVKDTHACDDTTAMDAMSSFKKECDKLEQQLFFTDFEENRRKAHHIEQEVEVMSKFLSDGPTKRISIIPRQLSDCFNKIDEMLQVQQNSIQSSIQLIGSSEKKLSNKWFTIKRQLWTWFLFNPGKVLRAIDQLELAVKQKRNEVK